MTEIATAIAWLWLGMVLAISFLEAPLKFRVVDIPTGLKIGRVVFAALNAVEAVLAVVVLVALFAAADCPRGSRAVAVAVAVVLLVQVALVRPLLARRSNAVLAGADAPRSRAHLSYVGLELLKVAGLVALGVILLRG